MSKANTLEKSTLKTEVAEPRSLRQVPAQGVLIYKGLVAGQTYKIQATGEWEIAPGARCNANGVDAVRTSAVDATYHPMRAAIRAKGESIKLQKHILAGSPWGTLTGLLIPRAQESVLEWLTGHIPLAKKWTDLTEMEILQIEHFFGNSFLVGAASLIVPRFDANLVLVCNDFIGGYDDNTGYLTVQLSPEP